MRVLLISPKSAFAFWNLGVLTKLTGSKAFFPPLGLLTVAALLPADWEFRLADLNTRELAEDDWNWCDLVMVSAMIVHRDDLPGIFREARERGKTLVVGGPYPSSVPEEVLRAGPDFLVRGEGENTIPLLVSALKEGKRSGVFENQEKPDLSKSPAPRYDLLNLKDYAVMGIQTSRGCPYDCEFCDVVHLFGRKLRYKSPDQVVRELETLFRLGWFGVVFICDDNFIGSRRNARAILREMIPWSKSRGEPFNFSTEASVDLGRDLEMIDLLTSANFTDVLIGIESPDESVLSTLGKYHNIRNPLAESVRTISRNGLSVMGTFILGLDGEQEGADKRICDFVEETGIPKVQLLPLTLLPNTRLWKRLKNEGRLPEEWSLGGLAEGRLNYVPTRPAGQVLREFVNAWNEIYEPSRYLERAYRYFLAMRPTRSAIGIEEEGVYEEIPPAKPTLRSKYYELLAPLRLIWWQGICRNTRLLFWRQLRGMRKNNPSRLVPYLRACAFGENMFRLRKDIRKKLAPASQDADQ